MQNCILWGLWLEWLGWDGMVGMVVADEVVG